MSLRERINEDMKDAMRAKDTARLSTIRLLQAAIKQKEVDERIAVDDAATLAIIEKQIKQRRDSIEQFDKAGRTDLADKERAELKQLADYLPSQMSGEEISAAIDAALVELGEPGKIGPQSIGKIMALLKPRLAGRADMSAVSALAKQRLA